MLKSAPMAGNIQRNICNANLRDFDERLKETFWFLSGQSQWRDLHYQLVSLHEPLFLSAMDLVAGSGLIIDAVDQKARNPKASQRQSLVPFIQLQLQSLIESGDRLQIGIGYHLLTLLQIRYGEFSEANASVLRAKMVFEEIGDTQTIALLDMLLSLLELARGNQEEAHRVALLASKSLEVQGNWRWLGICWMIQGIILMQKRLPNEAQAAFVMAAELRKIVDEGIGQAAAYMALTCFLISTGDWLAAHHYAKKGLQICHHYHLIEWELHYLEMLLGISTNLAMQHESSVYQKRLIKLKSESLGVKERFAYDIMDDRRSLPTGSAKW